MSIWDPYEPDTYPPCSLSLRFALCANCLTCKLPRITRILDRQAAVLLRKFSSCIYLNPRPYASMYFPVVFHKSQKTRSILRVSESVSLTESENRVSSHKLCIGKGNPRTLYCNTGYESLLLRPQLCHDQALAHIMSMDSHTVYLHV